jgi:hypothetical protein
LSRRFAGPRWSPKLLTIRAVTVALVLLFALDVAIRVFGLPWFPEDFRFPRVTTSGYPEYVDYMRRYPGPRVAVIGDSVMQGLFSDRSKTMPAYMNAIWDAETTSPPGPRAFNFGVSAAHANDLYAMVTDITSRKAADVVVVHFNYPFSIMGRDPYALRYPQLWQDAASFAPFQNDPLVTRYTKAPDQRTWPERGRQLLEQVWRLYGARDAFAAAWFESSAPEAWQKRYTEWERSQEGSSGPPPARKLLPRDFSRAQLSAIWSGPDFADGQPNIEYLRLMLRKAKAEGIPMVVTSGPVNLPILEYWGVLDKARYQRNVAFIRRLVQSEGGTFVDLSDDVSPRYVADSVHPFPEGYLLMAEETVKAVDPFLRDAAARRAARGR